MRVVHRKMIDMIRAGKAGSPGGNTTLTKSACPFVMSVYLHGRHIADVANGYGTDDAPAVRFTLAGWPTPTTRARINALLHAFMNDGTTYHGVGQRKGRQEYSTWTYDREATCMRRTDVVTREIDSCEWIQA
jgi:hypothetical protein